MVEHTFDYYLFKGTTEDLLNFGGPLPKDMKVEDAMQHSFEAYLNKFEKNSQNPTSKVKSFSIYGALEILKRYVRNFQYHTPVVIMLVNKGKLKCWHQEGISTYKHINIYKS